MVGLLGSLVVVGVEGRERERKQRGTAFDKA